MCVISHCVLKIWMPQWVKLFYPEGCIDLKTTWRQKKLDNLEIWESWKVFYFPIGSSSCWIALISYIIIASQNTILQPHNLFVHRALVFSLHTAVTVATVWHACRWLRLDQWLRNMGSARQLMLDSPLFNRAPLKKASFQILLLSTPVEFNQAKLSPGNLSLGYWVALAIPFFAR